MMISKSKQESTQIGPPAPPRSSPREQVAMTIKLLFGFGAGLGGLWLLDQIVTR
jgi:hypothetical protein